MMLSGEKDEDSNIMIRAARFKGNEANEFIDSKNFDGTLYNQIEETMKFIKIYIEKYSKIRELQRIDKYIIPIVAIREALVNAVVHRDYSIEGSSINVGIFDNRIEITSPGALPKSLDINDIKSGRSEVRNKVIARFFKEIRYIEQWGTGIKRIISLCKEDEIREPEFIESGAGVKVIIFKKILESADKSAGKEKSADKSAGKKEREIIIVKYVEGNNYITTKIAMELLGLKETATKNLIRKIVKNGILKVEGKGKSTRYELTQRDPSQGTNGN